MKQLVTQCILMGLVALVLGLGVNQARTEGIALVPPPSIEAQAAGADTTSASDQQVSLALVEFAEVDYFLRNQEAFFIDARSAEKYADGFIGEALNVPLEDYETGKVRVPVPKSTLIVLYCDGGDCDTSELLAREMAKDGYRRLRIYKGGIEEWVQLGMPLSATID